MDSYHDTLSETSSSAVQLDSYISEYPRHNPDLTNARLVHEPVHYFAHTGKRNPVIRVFFREAAWVSVLLALATLVMAGLSGISATQP